MSFGTSSHLDWPTHNLDQPGLPGGVLGTPSKVSTVESEGSVLGVSTSNSDLVDPLGSELGHGRLSTQLKLPLLSVVRSSRARSGALVPRVSSDTHSGDESVLALLTHGLNPVQAPVTRAPGWADSTGFLPTFR